MGNKVVIKNQASRELTPQGLLFNLLIYWFDSILFYDLVLSLLKSSSNLSEEGETKFFKANQFVIFLYYFRNYRFICRTYYIYNMFID